MRLFIHFGFVGELLSQGAAIGNCLNIEFHSVSNVGCHTLLLKPGDK